MFITNCVLPCLTLLMLVVIGGIVIHYGLLIFTRIKAWLLRHFGVETVGKIIQSRNYVGDGLHDNDPCIEAVFAFVDGWKVLHRRKLFITFDAFDLIRGPNLYLDYDEVVNQYRVGTVHQVIYFRLLPSIFEIKFAELIPKRHMD